MKLKHFFRSILAVAMATAVATAEQPAVNAPEGKPPEVQLPIEKPVNVAAYDAIKAADAYNWHVVQSKGPEAWVKNPRAKGKGIRVAVLDTGAQVSHPAIRSRIVATYNAVEKSRTVTDGNGHGTHCADTVRQLAPEADLVIVKVLRDNGSGSVVDIAHGIDWAVTEGKADVLSLSLGGPGQDQWQRAAIERAIKAGVIVVAAAGNDGGPTDTEGYPARYPGVVSVAAADRNNRLAPFSSWGPNVLTTKYGVAIRAALPGDKEGEMSGTSMACPSEAACAAAWVACHPQIERSKRPAEYRKAVIAASPFKERTNAVGYGLYTLDRLIPAGLPDLPVPPKPGKPVAVTITLDDLTPAKRSELAAGGVTKFRLEVGHDTAKPADVMPEVQAVPVPVPQSVYQQPAPVYQPIYSQPIYSQPAPAPLWVPGQVIRRILR